MVLILNLVKTKQNTRRVKKKNKIYLFLSISLHSRLNIEILDPNRLKKYDFYTPRSCVHCLWYDIICVVYNIIHFGVKFEGEKID